MSVDAFSIELLEEAKRFLEKHKESADGQTANLHAALVLGMCSLEAHVNSICDDFMVSADLDEWDKSVLTERSVELTDGEFQLTNRFKMQRLEDRILFLCKRFSKNPMDRNSLAWIGFKEALALRNKLVHPKEALKLEAAQVEKALQSILAILNCLFTALYKQPHPAGKRGMQSTLSF